MAPTLRSLLATLCLSAASLWLSGCAGIIEGTDDGAAASGTPSLAGPDAPPTLLGADSECLASGAGDIPETRLRRLGRTEYVNTLSDLGLPLDPEQLDASALTGDTTVGGAKRGFAVGGSVDAAVARDLLDSATSAAALSNADLEALSGCVPAAGAEEENCARSFIARFGRRAFRRSLVDAEVAELLEVFRSLRAEFDVYAGIEGVVASLLAAPEFVYLIEHGAAEQPGAIVPVDGPGLASRLSYFLWDSSPDEELIRAAESGALATQDQIEVQVRRMLSDPRAERAISAFIEQWTFIDDLEGTPKDTEQFDWYTPELSKDLRNSFVRSLQQALTRPESTLTELFGAETMFVNSGLADAYGLRDPNTNELVEVPTDVSQRRGLLTHPAFLAMAAKPSRSDPIHRGLFVRQQILCNQLPEPPDTDEDGNPIVFDIAPAEPGVPNRERFAQHTDSALCAGCHLLIDPIGFGFENYDAVGRYRTMDEHGSPIDAVGEVNSGGDVSGSFNGATELVERLTQSETVAECMTTQWFRFALSRQEQDADTCSNQRVLDRFLESGNNIHEMIVALTLSDSFRFTKLGAR